MIQDMISIIIPAYNSGKCIGTTLDNLFSQTYRNFEIIIAYDTKSTDTTLKIIEDAASRYKNIIIDIGTDRSSGGARNRGLLRASGEYVIFVDADDEIHPHYLETMMQIFTEHPELNVVCCDYAKVDEGTIQEGWREVERSPDSYAILPREDALYMALWAEIANTPWLFLVRHQYLVDNQITFPDYSISEDVVYVNKLIANTDAIGRSSKKLYIYILHPSSMSHRLTAENRWKMYESSRNDIMEYFTERDPEYADDFQTMAVRTFVYTSVLIHDYPDFRKEVESMGFHRMKMLHRHDKIPYMASVVCYSVSKRLFYALARMVADRMDNLSPLGAIREKDP